MLGCLSQATWVHGEIERSRRISESKTETVFGLESPCFSEIQRESVTQDGFFKLAKHSDITESGCPIVSDLLQIAAS